MFNPVPIIGIFWLLFIMYWLFSATRSKRTIRGKSWWYGAAIRFGIVVAIVLVLQFSSAQNFIAYYSGASTNPILNYLGVLLCAAGIAFAVWARVHLGRNWGMPMSLKENPELVTSGPYRYVRHPIYTGILLAMFGSALVAGAFWFIALVIFGIYFIYSSKVEEKLMTQQFSNRYLEYKKRTKALIPFIW